MARPIVTTSWTPRTVPTTEYTTPRDRSMSPVSFDSVEWSFDSTEISFDMTFRDLWPLTTAFSTPRYWQYVEDIVGNNVLDLLWEQVQWLTGGRTNKLDTFWQ